MTSRPGSNARQPHTDLRLPQLYSHDVARGTEASEMLSSAQLLASLHRAAEVARFEWRAQARTQAEAASNDVARERYSPLDAGSMLRAAQAADAAALRSTYQSGRRSEVDASDDDDDDSTSASSSDIEESDDDETERAVLQATLNATLAVRHDEARQRAAAAEATSPSARPNGSGFQSYVTPPPRSAESALDVWNRMIVDLANPESYPIAPPVSRFLPSNVGGWNFPLQPEQHQGLRSLPHPVWARRYPGPAGVWLRAELARRQGEARQRNSDDQTSTSAFPRLGSIVMPPHLTLATPSTPPEPLLGRDASTRNAVVTASEQPRRSFSTAASTSPSARSAAARVAHLANTARDRRRAQRTAVAAAAAPSAHDVAVDVVIAAMDAAVASSDLPRFGSEQRSRATRGGMTYLEHLRELDARFQARSGATAQPESYTAEQPAMPGHPSEVFPWYSPSGMTASISIQESTPVANQPLEAWYAPRQRAQQPRDATAVERARLRYGLPKPDEDDALHAINVSDQPRARPWRNGADVRMRHRAAQVVADVNQGAVGTERPAADGWTLIDPAARRPDTTRHMQMTEAPEQNQWLLSTTDPSRRFSSSPSPLATDEPEEPLSAVSAIRSGSGSSPRSLGRPRRLPSVTPEDIETLRAQILSSASTSPSATRLAPSTGTARPIPVHASAERRAEYFGMGTLRRSASPSPFALGEERAALVADDQGTTLATQLLRSADSWSSSAAAQNYESLLRRSSSPTTEVSENNAQVAAATPNRASVASPLGDPSAVASASNIRPDSEYFRSIQEDFQALSDQLPALSSDAIQRAQARLREFIDLFNEQQRSRISTLHREMEEQRMRLRRLVQASESRANDVQDAPSTSGGSSLVRRRTIRDSAPALRPYHRLESRRAVAADATTAATASASTDDLDEAMLALATLDAAVGTQDSWDEEMISGGTSPTLGSSSNEGGEGDKGLEDDAEHSTVAAPPVASASIANSLLTSDDALALGTLRAAMMRAVDLVGTSSYRAAIDRALHARTRHWTPDQPALPLNEELNNYPLRFEISPLNFIVADASSSSAVASGTDDSARLVGVLRNDESSFVASRSSNVDIGLRFLACLPHSGQTSRPLWRTEQQPQQSHQATHAPRTTLVAPASSDAERQATLARLTSAAHGEQVSSEDRIWARARGSVIGSNPDDARRALGLPPRSTTVASAPAPVRPAPTVPLRSEPRTGWAARIAALDQPLSEHQIDLLARLGFARWNVEENSSEGLDGRRSRLNRIAPLASLSSEDIGEIRRLIASLFPEVHATFPPPPDATLAREGHSEATAVAASPPSTNSLAALAPLALTSLQRQLLSTSISQARASPRSFAESSASSQPAIQQLIQSRSASFAEAAVLQADATRREHRSQVVPSFTLCRLTIKVPSRPDANSVMEGLVFVSHKPITASQLQHYDDWTFEDVQHLARREGFPFVRNALPVVPPRTTNTTHRTHAAALDQWDADPELGVPSNSARAGFDSEVSSDNISASMRSAPPADAVRPAGFFHIPAGSAQATLDFMRSRISPNALPDSDVFTVGAAHRRRLQGISGSYIAVKLLRSVREAPVGPFIQPGCEIQWIGAFGWAGVRSSGTAQWRDLAISPAA